MGEININKDKKEMIEGLVIQELKKITDERGKIMHMLRCDSDLFKRFGEIYFSVVNKNIVKAWKKHLKMTQHFAVPVGKIKLILYDNRKGSLTFGRLNTVELGEDCYFLVKIPPDVWYGFKGISDTPALIANCTDIPHDPDEVVRLDPFSPTIPYRWDG